MTMTTQVVLGGRYTFDTSKDIILKRGLLDPYSKSDIASEWVVLKEYVFWSKRLQKVIVVPNWMPTDLASIPRAFRFLIGVNERHRIASLVHDFGYRLAGQGETHLTRKDWDLVLRDFCFVCGVPKWKAYTMYWALRAGGIFAYRSKEPSMHIPLEHREWYVEQFKSLSLSVEPGKYVEV